MAANQKPTRWSWKVVGWLGALFGTAALGLAKAAGAKFVDPFFDLLHSIWRYVVNFVSWMGTDVSISRWHYSLLALVAAVAGFFIVLILFQWLRQKFAPSRPKYTEDEFLGIKWRWGYNNGRIVAITPFCAKCNRLIRPRTGSYMGTAFICQACGPQAERSESYDEIEAKIRVEIIHYLDSTAA